MRQSYNLSAPKKPANLSINNELLSIAKDLKLNLSATLEKALAEEVRKAECSKWLEENKTAINVCNEIADKNGLFSDAHRVL